MPPTTRRNGTQQTAPPTVPALQPLAAPSPAELAEEYVASGGYLWYSRLARTLPPSIDDITSDFGDDLYERMLLDPTIAKCVSIFKASVLEDGTDLNSAVKDETDPDYELAMRIRDEAEAMLDELETSLDDVLWNMADHIAMGNVVAELRFDLKPGAVEKRELLQLVAIKPKPRRVYAFVVDAYMNVVGILGQRPGESNPYMGQIGIDPKDSPNLLSREKFAIATFRPRNSDPRGTSILRPAYDAWWRKRQLIPEYLKYLVQFAGPSIWGTTPERAQTQPPLDYLANPTLDSQGNLNPPYTTIPDVPVSTDPYGQNPKPSGSWTMTPEQRLTSAIMEFRSGTAAAFPFGTELHALEMKGEGMAFLRAKADCDRDIIGSILTQTLATEEGEHQARAAAQVHQDVLDTLIRQAKRGIVRMLRRDILRPWVRYNWGERALHLVPLPNLGHTETQDLAPLITAMSTVGYSIDESQLPDIDELLNLPVRDLTQSTASESDTGAGLPSSGSDAGGPEDVPTPSSGHAGAAQPSVPSSRRVNVRGHSRGRPPRRVGMSDGPIKPKVGDRPGAVPDVAYSDADRRALLEVFEDAFPEYSGLLDAKVSQ